MLRKPILLLMLLVTPLAQARLVFVCSMMEGRAFERCCCEELKLHRAPRAPERPHDEECCATAVELTRTEVIAAPVDLGERQVTKLDDDAPELVPELPPLALMPPPRAPPARIATYALPLHSARIYLETLRLRL